MILSNVRGLYRRFPDEATLAGELARASLPEALTWAQGRMKRKVLGAQEALAGGVGWARIGDGSPRTTHSGRACGGGHMLPRVRGRVRRQGSD